MRKHNAVLPNRAQTQRCHPETARKHKAVLPNGLDVDSTLYYNSRVWNTTPGSSVLTLNADRDFPDYGFRLDYGYLAGIF